MALAIEIVVGLVVLMVLAVAALRIRKLRRDEVRELTRPVERRLMAPPPSPYAPSKGFRLLDGPIEAANRPEPLRPRLESDREYVFSESQMSGDAELVPTQLRHNEKWALSKSARRTTSVSGARVAVIATVAVVVIGAIGLYLQHRDSKNTPTTTTTITHTTTTALSLPSPIVSSSTNVDDATYRVTQNYDGVGSARVRAECERHRRGKTPRCHPCRGRRESCRPSSRHRFRISFKVHAIVCASSRHAS